MTALLKMRKPLKEKKNTISSPKKEVEEKNPRKKKFITKGKTPHYGRGELKLKKKGTGKSKKKTGSRGTETLKETLESRKRPGKTPKDKENTPKKNEKKDERPSLSGLKGDLQGKKGNDYKEIICGGDGGGTRKRWG